MIKKLFTIIICLIISVLSIVGVSAGSGEINTKRISTEYMSEELLTPLEDALSAVASVADLQIAAKAVVLMEPSTGEILYENNSHEKLAPASITKIMSLILVMEAIDAGKLSVDTKVKASEYACSMGGSQIWLEPNETMTVDELLKATVIASANDATVALGEAVAGSEEGFIAMMNAKAKALNMVDTQFVNCTGLDAAGHVTSAYDVAIMSSELIKYELIKKYSTIWMDSLREGKSSLVNTNKLVRFYEGSTGLKTGTTSAAGSCVSATAKRENLELCAVVMGASNSNDRFNGARKLLDYGFANWSFTDIRVEQELIPNIKIAGGTKTEIGPMASEIKSLLIPKGKKDSITVDVECATDLKAPISKGERVGVARIMLEGEELGTIGIVSAQDVQEMSFLTAFMRLIAGFLTL